MTKPTIAAARVGLCRISSPRPHCICYQVAKNVWHIAAAYGVSQDLFHNRHLLKGSLKPEEHVVQHVNESQPGQNTRHRYFVRPSRRNE